MSYLVGIQGQVNVFVLGLCQLCIIHTQVCDIFICRMCTISCSPMCAVFHSMLLKAEFLKTICNLCVQSMFLVSEILDC